MQLHSKELLLFSLSNCMWLVHPYLLDWVYLPSPGSYQYDQSPLPCRLWVCDLSDINRPLKPLRRRLLMMWLGFNPLKNPASIFPHPRVTGVRLHELPRSEYISGQLNCIIDQQIARVCLPDILEVDYRAVATIEDIKAPSSGIFMEFVWCYL